jgi:hypothetical protein
LAGTLAGVSTVIFTIVATGFENEYNPTTHPKERSDNKNYEIMLGIDSATFFKVSLLFHDCTQSFIIKNNLNATSTSKQFRMRTQADEFYDIFLHIQPYKK